MTLPRLQYITHPDERFDDLSWVHRLHEGGVRWIQLRIKEEDVYRRFPQQHHLAYFHETADALRAITSALGMLLTINDAADVAVFSHADGLHVGQEDEAPATLRARLLPGQLLGGTANTVEEMQRYSGAGMTYFGVGPYRNTTTKAKLKPVLGLEGYRGILEEMKHQQLAVPLFAIGGIEQGDIAGLLAAGVYGVAVSGLFFHNGHDPETVKNVLKELEAYELETGR